MSDAALVSLKQLPMSARRAHVYVAIKIMSRSRASIRFSLGVLKALNEKKITNEQAKTSLICHFGRSRYHKAFAVALSIVSKAMLKNRRMVDGTNAKEAACACHACLSYQSQVTCLKCNKLRYCIGCADYGECLACSPIED